MNIYDAIMKAADHIDSNPKDFRFTAVDIPGSCGTPGCALGWIGHFAGLRDLTVDSVSKDFLKIPDGHRFSSGMFYEAMKEVFGNSGWINDNKSCALSMRLYAAKYHKPQFTGLPDIVRDIFKERVS